MGYGYCGFVKLLHNVLEDSAAAAAQQQQQ
jgi:hypothetical protein